MPVISRAERQVGVNATPQPYSTGDGYQAIGQGIKSLGAALGKLGEQADEQEMFKAKMAVSEYEFNKAKEEDERAFNFVPGRDGAAADYDRDFVAKRTQDDQQFLSQFSGKAQQAAALHLQQSRQSAALRAQNHRQGFVTQETIGLVQAQTARAATTVDGSFDSVFPALKAIDEAVRSAPGLTERQRFALREQAAEAALAAWESKAPWQEKEKRLQEMRGSVGKWLKGFEGKEGTSGDGPLDKTYVDQIKKFEGFAPRATWDYKQHSVGYGTRASHAGETIDRAEADRRLNAELGKAADIVDKFAPGLDAGTRAALTSLTFNAGSSWTTGRLGQQIKAGDLEGAKQTFLAYNKAGGETLPGLVSRRQAEARWFGQSAGPALAKAEGAPLTGTPPDETGGDNGDAAFISARDRLKLPDSATMGDHVIKRFLPRVDRLEKQVLAGKADQEARLKVAGWLSGQVPFNAHDAAGKKDIDTVVGQTDIQDRIFAADPQAIGGGMALSGRLNYVPGPVLSGLKGLIDSPDAKHQRMGYDAVLGIFDKNPNAFDVSGGHEALLKEAEYYRTLTRLRTPDEAIKMIREGKMPGNKIMKAAGEEDTKKFMKGLEGKEIGEIAESMDTGYSTLLPRFLNFGTPQTDADKKLQQAIIYDFRQAAKAEFERTGNEDASKSAALVLLKRRYGASSITGQERIMPYPPEKHFPVGPDGTHKYISDDLASTVSTYGTAAKDGSVVLIPNGSKGDKPAYLISIERKDDGKREVLPIIWQPPFDPRVKQAFDEKRKSEMGSGDTAPAPKARTIGEMGEDAARSLIAPLKRQFQGKPEGAPDAPQIMAP